MTLSSFSLMLSFTISAIVMVPDVLPAGILKVPLARVKSDPEAVPEML